MKIANVVSAQVRGTHDTSTQEVVTGRRAERMSDFLRRYPAIEDSERRELLLFLTGGPQEEIVEVTRLQGLESQYELFRRDHPREFSSTLYAWLPLILVIAIAILGAAWRILSY